MLSQTIDQLLPVLQMLQQPGFCVKNNGTVLPNRPAVHLAPCSGQSVAQWLGDATEVYEGWDRKEALILPVPLGGGTATVTIQALADGEFFLLSDCSGLSADSSPLAVAAQVLRQPLTDLNNLTFSLAEDLEDMEDPLLQDQTAAITRQLYRLTRIACNLSDLQRMQNGTYQADLQKMELQVFLEELLPEVTDLCREAGRELVYEAFKEPVYFNCDAMLLERALLNLISNALKYSQPGTPIVLQIDTTSTAIRFRVRNQCAPEHRDLLWAAFQRMEQRGVLPDPQWGMGLGLPMTRYIAQLLGGIVAVSEDDGHTATVLFSVSRKRPISAGTVTSPIPYDYTGGLRRTLVELADSLPNLCFDSISL